jgi:hypothetical protein
MDYENENGRYDGTAPFHVSRDCSVAPFSMNS